MTKAFAEKKIMATGTSNQTMGRSQLTNQCVSTMKWVGSVNQSGKGVSLRGGSIVAISIRNAQN